MAHAYTPGLRVTQQATIRKERMLPIAGEVLVAVGAKVQASDVIARAELPGDVATVNVVNQLGIGAGDLERFMLKKVGEAVTKDEPIAQNRPLIKWFRRVVRAPVSGSIETVSSVTGQVLLRTPPRPVEVRAYVDGVVVEVRPGEGAVIETTGAFVQGILGVGGEIAGELVLAADSPKTVLTPKDLNETFAGKIVVAGALVTYEVYQRASQLGIAALVCGGFHDADLRRLLGYDLGVAITGHETLRPILIMTEGFGDMAMAERTFSLLKANAGRRCSANGATQIRAGVLRPEIIIPAAAGAQAMAGQAGALGLTEGSPVRIIRQPGFGRLGTVKSLPSGVQLVESEARVRVIEVQFPEGDVAIVPRANVEAIES
jgi:hypothetical protein